MPVGIKETRLMDIQVTDADVDVFIAGIEELAKNMDTPGFKQGKKKEIALLFSTILENLQNPENIEDYE